MTTKCNGTALFRVSSAGEGKPILCAIFTCEDRTNREREMEEWKADFVCRIPELYDVTFYSTTVDVF